MIEDRVVDELRQLATKLISFKTVEKNIDIQRDCLHYIGKYLGVKKELYFSHYTNRDQPYMVVSTEDTKEPDILLSGHIDVVPGSEDQFNAKYENGRIYGRGSLDMKGGVAVIVLLLRDLLQSGQKIPSLALMLTSDEEIGSVGAKWLVDEKGWRAKFILIPEGERKFRFVTKEKGVCWIKMIAHGKAAHAAYPWRADNALLKAYGAYEKIRVLFPPPADKWQSTICLTKVDGNSTASNQVPSYAEALLDIRYTDDLAENGHEIVDILQQMAPEVRFELVSNGDKLSVDDDNVYVKHLQTLVSQRLGRSVPIQFNHGASDASAFARLKVPAMTSGITGDNHHGDDEYVNLQSMVDYYFFSKKFVETFRDITQL